MYSKPLVVHLIQSLENGGCENMLLRTLPYISENLNHKVVVLKSPGALTPHFRAANIPVETIGVTSFLDIPGLFRLRKRLRELRPALILTYLFHADMFGRVLLRTLSHTPPIPFLRTTYNHPRYWSARLAERLTGSLVPRYLANSEAVKHFYVAKLGVNERKITVIPNGIDFQRSDSVHLEQLGPSLGIPAQDFIFICVANLQKNKGHDYLLSAFQSLLSRIPHIRLLIVGEGEERSRLEDLVHPHHSSIQFLGRRDDVKELLQIADCFVLPTLFEGMSNALLEAMAAGLPVITTDIPENRALVSNDITGLLVRPRDAQALASAMENLVREAEERKRLGQAARKHVETHYSLHTIARQWEAYLLRQINE